MMPRYQGLRVRWRQSILCGVVIMLSSELMRVADEMESK